jgi:hypothetical protein
MDRECLVNEERVKDGEVMRARIYSLKVVDIRL